MLELDKKVFGEITTKEVIGATPTIPDMKSIFEEQFSTLIEQLNSLSKENLEELLSQQVILKAHINSRPGAMALAQNKIQLFNEYNQKYVDAINKQLAL